MSLLSKIIPGYEYCYFDQYNQFQTKQLNIFQRVARNIFGCYAETHLSNVINQAYKVTLNDNLQATTRKNQKLLELIRKAKHISYVHLSTLADHSTEILSIKYTIEKVGDTFKIASIDFETKTRKLFTEIRFSIFKNKDGNLLVELAKDPFKACIFNPGEVSEDSIKDGLKYRVKKITNLLAKILKDSSADSAMNEIRYYVDDCKYTYRPSTSSFGRSGSKKSIDSTTLNSAQEEGMQKLGWEYLGQYQEIEQCHVSAALEKRYVDNRDNYVVNEKRVYLLKREVAEKNPDLIEEVCNHNLSLAFAASHLKYQKKEC